MTLAWIGLGSNQHRPFEQIQAGLKAIDDLPGSRLVDVSQAYRSAPWGGVEQPDFVNAVASLDTALDARTLLDHLQAIENRQGRRRLVRWGPRTLDLDLLVFGDQQCDGPELTLPHPRLHQRAFVLLPLASLAPQLEVPGKGRVDALLSALPASEKASVRVMESVKLQYR